MGGRGGGGGGSGGGKGGGGGGVAEADAAKSAVQSDIEQIFNAYMKINGGLSESVLSDWVGLADLRDATPGLTRDRFDRAVYSLAMGDQYVSRVVPVANRKALRQRDWDAAINIGDEEHVALNFSQRPRGYK